RPDAAPGGRLQGSGSGKPIRASGRRGRNVPGRTGLPRRVQPIETSRRRTLKSVRQLPRSWNDGKFVELAGETKRHLIVAIFDRRPRVDAGRQPADPALQFRVVLFRERVPSLRSVSKRSSTLSITGKRADQADKNTTPIQ